MSQAGRRRYASPPSFFCYDPDGLVHWAARIVQKMLSYGGFGSNRPRPGVFVSQSTGKDLPLSEEDLYRCSDDAASAQRINTLSSRIENGENNYHSIVELLRLNVITGRRPNHVQPLIQRAKALAPQDSLPYKYAAIYYVNTFFQYQTALKEINAYLQYGGDVVFGRNVEGFLHYRLKQYEQSVAALEKVIVTAPDDVYALSLLARVYSLRYPKLNDLDPRRQSFQASARKYLRRAQSTSADDVSRVHRVATWMQSKGVL